MSNTSSKKSALRTCACAEVTTEKLGEKIKICGWVMSKRDHGGIVFADIRDHYGIVQATIDIANTDGEKIAKELNQTPNESVVQITGIVKRRRVGTERPEVPTGKVEIEIETFNLLSKATNELPFQIDDNAPEANESIRLANRFFDLRRTKMQNNLKTRSKVLQFLRNEMTNNEFTEIQTPILTAPTPEGATDYLVPSRLHPTQFYALPQSPQQFKQLLMVSGIDRYFQIAPCFRNEDARADRAVGEFYQLDVEMSFVEQQDIINTIEPVVQNLFNKFKPQGYTTNYSQASDGKIPSITYKETMEKYGTDKPDLRIPTENHNLTEVFRNSGFGIFKNAIANGSIAISILAPNTANKSRSFFDSKIDFAKSLGGGGLAYIKLEADGTPNSPIAKLLTEAELNQIKTITNAQNGDTVFFVCEKPNLAYKIAGEARLLLGKELELIEPNTYKFLWVTDFPMFEVDPHTNKVSFSHNPFSKATKGNVEAQGLTESNTRKPTVISGNARIHGNSVISGGATVSGNADVGGNTRIHGNVLIDGDIKISGSGKVVSHYGRDNSRAIKEITCQQYDLVCNGYEIGSGGIRNTSPEEMKEAFRRCEVNITQFNAMYKAFSQAGTPPHGGIAIGLERLLMLLCQTTNIRDVIAFPLNSVGMDYLMEAPRMLPKAEQEKSFSTDYTKLGTQEQLHYACVHNLPELAKTAINKGANINYQGNYGKTPLMAATQSNSRDIIKFMAKSDAIAEEINIKATDAFNRRADLYTNKKATGLELITLVQIHQHRVTERNKKDDGYYTTESEILSSE